MKGKMHHVMYALKEAQVRTYGISSFTKSNAYLGLKAKNESDVTQLNKFTTF